MLNNCPACNGTISNQAITCPHCGHPLIEVSQTARPKEERSSTFTILSGIGFLVCLFTPKLIVALPIFGTAICAVIAIFRKEPSRIVSGIILIITLGLLFSGESSVSSVGQSESSTDTSLSAVKIDDWNWIKDPDFAGKGTIHWNVKVSNVSDKYIDMVRVELTTFDQAGKLIATDYDYVNSIPPGSSRSEEGYADYYGTEKSANIQVTEVRFAR